MLHLPADITALAASGTGATTVTYSATATDVVDGSDPVTCSSPSGSTFLLGTTTVTCSSRDAHGNTATGSFHVNVFDFTVSLTPSDRTVLRGGVASFKVTTSSLLALYDKLGLCQHFPNQLLVGGDLRMSFANMFPSPLRIESRAKRLDTGPSL